jgi:hypothetical protein
MFRSYDHLQVEIYTFPPEDARILVKLHVSVVQPSLDGNIYISA